MIRAVPLPTKDPSSVLPYGVKWADWLTQEDDTIATSTWDVPDGLIQGDDYLTDGVTEEIVPGTTVTNSVAVVWLSEGVHKTEYRVTNRIVTTGGRTEEHSLIIYVEEL